MRRIQLSGIRPGVAVRTLVSPTELNGFVSAKKAELVAPECLSVKKTDRRQRGTSLPLMCAQENYTRTCARARDGRGCVEDGGRIFQKGTDD